ncbi:hypothetical protein WR25_25364 [Diploscapter pachys]|uniref:Uncharacterized protein n=1 Tax=Diploscapter pachys TaxID=2018661 RepID=A0A2A2JRK7_9BILA|nr:hypothetical protein WR25_25364 [Diploscapter pachys]
MRTKFLTTFILLTAAYLITAKPKKKQPESRHNCQCTNNHSPVCGCQILPNTVIDRNYQMQCSCTPPGPTKCVCQDASQNPKNTKKVKTLRDMSPYPALSVSVPMTSASSSNGCSDVCQSSCIASCSHLQTSSKCGDICASACVFSCSRNEKPGTTVAEYKFIVPSPEKTTTLIPMATSAPVLRQPPVYVVEPAPPVPVPMPVQKVCDSDCMPECSITCTYLKPALKLLKGFLDKDTSSSQCLSTCTDSCKKICTGVSTVECKDNCAPVCSETCSLTASKPQKCTSLCLPACDPQCIQLSIQIEQSTHSQLVRSVPAPSPPTVTPFLPASMNLKFMKKDQLFGKVIIFRKK